jgi:large subunit ribosomal protein L35
MPKMKTNRGARKRFTVTKSGKIKYNRANRRHILTKKSSKRKRQLRAGGILSKGDAQLVRRLLPNG